MDSSLSPSLPSFPAYLLRHATQWWVITAAAAAGCHHIRRRHDRWCVLILVLPTVLPSFLRLDHLLQDLQSDFPAKAEPDQQVRCLALQLVLYDVCDISCC